MLFAVVYNFRKLNLQIVEEAFGFQKNNSSFTPLRYCMYLLKQEMTSTSDIFLQKNLFNCTLHNHTVILFTTAQSFGCHYNSIYNNT
jgi:hypothetical protein